MKFSFAGFNHSIHQFVLEFFKTLKQIANEGLDEKDGYLIHNSYELLLKRYRAANLDIYDRTYNNRLLLLREHEYHADVIATHLEDNYSHIRSSILSKEDNFAKRAILDKVKFTRFIITGNYTNQNAIDLARGVSSALELKKGNQKKEYRYNISAKVGKI